jgi:hypothetical protein
LHVHKVQAHVGISGNEIADTLANEGTLEGKPNNTPHIHIAHPTPYWLASCPTATHDGASYNLYMFIRKTHKNHEIELAKRKFPYVDKWLSNKQINQKLPNHFWKKVHMAYTQITQTLKYRHAQYMGNHRRSIF